MIFIPHISIQRHPNLWALEHLWRWACEFSATCAFTVNFAPSSKRLYRYPAAAAAVRKADCDLGILRAEPAKRGCRAQKCWRLILSMATMNLTSCLPSLNSDTLQCPHCLEAVHFDPYTIRCPETILLRREDFQQEHEPCKEYEGDQHLAQLNRRIIKAQRKALRNRRRAA